MRLVTTSQLCPYPRKAALSNGFRSQKRPHFSNTDSLYSSFFPSYFPLLLECHFVGSTSAAATSSTATNTSLTTTTNGGNPVQCRAILETDPTNNDSSESETENDLGTTEKFLLLVDQLSLEQQKHLGIKDIGIILERLSSKIVDVERLERDLEGSDTHNWTIKATIRGEILRELGVIYNSNYYSISEHPAYDPPTQGTTYGLEDEEDEPPEEEQQ